MACGAAYSAEKKGPPAKPDDRDYCAACHEQQAQASLKKPVKEWKSSVHAGEGKKCSLCHGGDPGTNDKVKAKSKLANFIGRPDKKMIAEFCGREGCHATALDQFRRGPHYLPMQKTDEPGCVFCHGTHNIQRSSLEVITAKSCTLCHPAENAKETVSMIGNIDRSLSVIDGGIRTLSDKHAEVAGMKDRLNSVRHLFHQMVHVFSHQEMESSRKVIDMEVKSLEAESRSKLVSIQRLDFLYYTMVVFGVAIICGMFFYVLVMYSRRKK
jgi:hypothetical protein